MITIRDYFWYEVAAEVRDGEGRLPQQYRERYMSAVFLAELTWVFYVYLLAEYRPPPFYLYLMTAEIALPRPHPPRPYVTRSHIHTRPVCETTRFLTCHTNK